MAKQYKAWKKVLRKAKIAGMKHTDLKSRQTFYVKNGGYLQAIRDFDSAKPDDVRSFKGTNMVCIHYSAPFVNKRVVESGDGAEKPLAFHCQVIQLMLN